MWFGRKTNFSTSLALMADHSRPFIGDHQKSNYWDELLSFPALKLELLHMSMLIVDMASFSSVFLPSEVRAVTALGPGTPGAHPRMSTLFFAAPRPPYLAAPAICSVPSALAHLRNTLPLLAPLSTPVSTVVRPPLHPAPVHAHQSPPAAAPDHRFRSNLRVAALDHTARVSVASLRSAIAERTQDAPRTGARTVRTFLNALWTPRTHPPALCCGHAPARGRTPLASPRRRRDPTTARPPSRARASEPTTAAHSRRRAGGRVCRARPAGLGWASCRDPPRQGTERFATRRAPCGGLPHTACARSADREGLSLPPPLPVLYVGRLAALSAARTTQLRAHAFPPPH